MNRRLLNVLRVVVSVGLLAFVLWTNDPTIILAELRRAIFVFWSLHFCCFWLVWSSVPTATGQRGAAEYNHFI